jgi:hypothetical protein
MGYQALNLAYRDLANEPNEPRAAATSGTKGQARRLHLEVSQSPDPQVLRTGDHQAFRNHSVTSLVGSK